jgi:tetratricopeptide (TPR) repeat protein
MSAHLHLPSIFASCLLRAARNRAFTAVILAGILLPPAAARGDDNDSWVGERIMTRMPGVTIGHSGWVSGLLFSRQVYVADAELTDMVYTVLREQDGWLAVRQRGVEGWLPKEQAVLLQDAVAYFTQRLRANGEDAFALGHRGSAWREQGESEKALADLNEAIRLDPSTAAWYSNRGMVYEELQEYDDAIADYSEAIRLDPNDARSYLNRGIAHKAKRAYDQAIHDYGMAIRLDPSSSDAFFGRGNAYKAMKRYDLAIRDYNEAIRLDPQWPDPYFNRALAHKAARAYDQAVRDYREVIRLDPKDADAYSNLAWLLATCPEEKVRDGDKAVEYATKACDLTSWEGSYHLAALSVAYAEIGKFDEAIHWQRKALASPQYDKEEGKEARRRIQLFEDGRPYREE